jgi:hypothetical protein
MKQGVFCLICEESNSVIGYYDESLGFSKNEDNFKITIDKIIEAKSLMPLEFKFLNIQYSSENKLYAALSIKKTDKTIYEFE